MEEDQPHRDLHDFDSYQFAEEVVSDFRSASAAAGIENVSAVVPIRRPTIRHFTEMDSILLFGAGSGISNFISAATQRYGSTACILNIVQKDYLRGKVKGLMFNPIRDQRRIIVDRHGKDRPTSVMEIGTWPCTIGHFSLQILFYGELEDEINSFSHLTRQWMKLALCRLMESEDPV